MQEKIVQLGYDCKIIPFIEPNGYYEESWLGFRKLKAKLSRNQSVYQFYKKTLPFYRFRKKYLRFEKSVLGKTNYYYTYWQLQTTPLKYDVYVCGSDQIWNPTFYGKNNPAYFLQFTQDKRRISYAPSIGLSEMPKEYQAEFKEYVSTFYALSTREEKGAEIVKKVGGRDCATVLDPTLLQGSEFWKDKTKKPKNFSYQKYIF
ncbi:MAG: polysaccharide pyruvyl transferase family protein [Clostridia bacterium]|nr:polysaccharide pyruvyl transferase family protein [Clostridia bacterium]